MKPIASNDRGNLLFGWLGLIALPILLATDSLWAIRQGWIPATAGAFGKLSYLAIAFLPFSIAAMVVPGWRRFLARNWRQLWLLTATTALALAVAEGFTRSARPRPDFHLRVPGMVYEYEPDSFAMPGVFDVAHTTINSRGIRGPEIETAKDEYRILCVGGSTTECYYLDDAESWPALLMKDLNSKEGEKTWVGSVGYSEFASGDHLRFLKSSSLLNDVNCVVLLVGVNDYLRLLLGFDMGTAAQPYWLRSALVDMVKEVWNVRLGQGFVVDRTGEGLARRRLGSNIPPRELNLDVAVSQFKDRMRQTVEVAKGRGLRVVLVTQPAMWDDFLTILGNRRLRFARLYPYPREWEYITPGNCRKALQLYNQALRDVAEETAVGFIDPAESMSGIEMYYYDDFHLSERGCEEMARILADWFAAHPPQSTTAR